MSDLTSRSEDPIELWEHQFAPHRAKRVVLIGQEPGGEPLVVMTHSLRNSNALGVVQINEDGDPAHPSIPVLVTLYSVPTAGAMILATNLDRRRLVLSRGDGTGTGTLQGLQVSPVAVPVTKGGIPLQHNGVYLEVGSDVYRGAWYARSWNGSVDLTIVEYE